MGTTDTNSRTIVAITSDREVRALLAACDLPTGDLDTPAAGLELYGCRDRNGPLIGTVGLETAGRGVLLRSLAVAPAHRGRGVATLLLAFAGERAATAGFERTHLLSTTAVAYFANRGYKYEQRDRAPAGVRATAQYMTKTVTGKPT